MGCGRIQDIEGDACIVCPNHSYVVRLKDGSRVEKRLKMEDGTMTFQGYVYSDEKHQRVHPVRIGANGCVEVMLASRDVPRCASDAKATSDTVGMVCIHKARNNR